MNHCLFVYRKGHNQVKISIKQGRPNSLKAGTIFKFKSEIQSSISLSDSVIFLAVNEVPTQKEKKRVITEYNRST